MAWAWLHPVSRRWYEAELTVDVLGDLVLELRWGGATRPRAGTRLIPLSSRDSLRDALRALRARRRAHGYLEAGSPADDGASTRASNNGT